MLYTTETLQRTEHKYLPKTPMLTSGFTDIKGLILRKHICIFISIPVVTLILIFGSVMHFFHSPLRNSVFFPFLPEFSASLSSLAFTTTYEIPFLEKGKTQKMAK